MEGWRVWSPLIAPQTRSLHTQRTRAAQSSPLTPRLCWQTWPSSRGQKDRWGPKDFDVDAMHAPLIKVSGLGFELTMPDIILDVLIEGVDIATVIEVDIGDFTDIKPDVKDVRFRDIGHIDVSWVYSVQETTTFTSAMLHICFLLGWDHWPDPGAGQLRVPDHERGGEHGQEGRADPGHAATQGPPHRAGQGRGPQRPLHTVWMISSSQSVIYNRKCCISCTNNLIFFLYKIFIRIMYLVLSSLKPGTKSQSQNPSVNQKLNLFDWGWKKCSNSAPPSATTHVGGLALADPIVNWSFMQRWWKWKMSNNVEMVEFLYTLQMNGSVLQFWWHHLFLLKLSYLCQKLIMNRKYRPWHSLQRDHD